MPGKRMEIHFPMRGVARIDGFRTAADVRGPYPSPWAVNCRVNDNLDRRNRGGSRPGLTKFVSDDMGTTIADMISVNVSSATGASEILIVLVDSTIKAVENGTTTTPLAYLTNSGGDFVTDASGDRIVVSSGAAPAAGFLVTGQQGVFAVTTSAIVKVDPKTGQIDNLQASNGTIPTSCTFGAVFNDRLCLSGADNAIYMSRQGDFTNWDFGDHFEDTQRAIPFQLSLASDVGPAPTAMIPFLDDYLLCASKRTLWLVSGDPGAEGTLQRVSENTGIIGSRAWCRIENQVCFLAEDGVYLINADGSGLRPLSEISIPEELRDVDTSTVTVSLGYEHDRRSLHVYLRTSSGSDTHWVYEIPQQAWWAVRLQDTHSPLVVVQHQGSMLLAGGDGFVRKVGGNDDDGTAIDSHVVLGPMRLATANHYGRLTRLHAMIAAGSGSVTWRIVPGDTAEEAADNAKAVVETLQSSGDVSSLVRHSGTWAAGRSIPAYPRTRAVFVCLVISSSSRWAYEGAVMEAVRSGMWRG